jgi:hypothetical protein
MIGPKQMNIDITFRTSEGLAEFTNLLREWVEDGNCPVVRYDITYEGPWGESSATG